MANISLPKVFEEILGSDQKLEGVVKMTLSNFGDVLKENTLYFFPEYTDHGRAHIENVISASATLVTEQTLKNVLTAKDIAYYTLSVILHDIGMHLSLEGFQKLISGEFDTVRIDHFDSLSWKKLWEEYLSEARKFSGKQLRGLFGNENIVIKSPDLFDKGNITENDKKLVGEFLRRHHARLAHEISLKGFPEQKGYLPFGDGLEDSSETEIKNLIGVIARSHGIGLRKCVDYLEKEYGKSSRRHPLGVHAVFLMVLLRIADYIQIDKSRISEVLLKLRTFSSPVSELENFAHLSIKQVDRQYQDDPERIYVTAGPKESAMYLKLKKLIADIQYEFDLSWAVLGEVYGFISDKPEIKYRRITSNLDDDAFIKKQNYVAEKFYFKANDDITKLLIAPLYGSDPKFGIRELLQNAVDACKERQEKLRALKEPYTPAISITIEKSGTSYTFTIEDNGIGMDVDVIKNYFFNAGASFRKSLDWQKEFVDEHGISKVRRSGRFGVGILASFLIGKKIHVATRKLNSQIGYEFEADLNSQQINVLKNNAIKEGTIITIEMEEENVKKLEPKKPKYSGDPIEWFEWYTLVSPDISYRYLGTTVVPYQSKLNPDLDNVPNDWFDVDAIGFDKILWTYSKQYANQKIVCNGIVVLDENHTSVPMNFGLMSNYPNISVFDSNANLPLTLDRRSFSSPLPFAEELRTDIYKDFIACILSFNKMSRPSDELIPHGVYKLPYPGFSDYEYNKAAYGYGVYKYSYNEGGGALRQIADLLLVSKKGFIVNCNFFINKLKSIKSLFIDFDKPCELHLDLKDRFISFTINKVNSINDYRNAIEARNYNFEKDRYEPWKSNVFLKKDKYSYLFGKNKRMPRVLKDVCVLHNQTEHWVQLYVNGTLNSIIDAKFLETFANNLNFIREHVIECGYQSDMLLDKLLEDYLGEDVIIPFELEERRAKYPHAFKELERYIVNYL